MWIYTSYFAHMGKQLTSPAGELTTATYVFVKTLFKLLKNYSVDLLAVAMDSHFKTFRKQLFDGYKSNRPENMPEGISQQIERIEQILGIMGIPVYHAPGYEADDILGTIVEKAQDRDIMVTICTRDKDVLQLVKKSYVDVLDINKDIRTGFMEVFDKWGVFPSQFIDFLALQGDPSDNVPGIRGIGPKKAVELLKCWCSSENIYENLDSINEKTAQKLRDGKEDFILSKDLVTIRRNVPLDIDFKAMEVKDFDWEKLNPMFEELGFVSLMQARTKNRRLF